MYILGMAGYFHDAAACLVHDGQLIAAAEEERFTRVKHQSGIPHKAISYCLGEAGITLDQVDYIGFYMNPWLAIRKKVPFRLLNFSRGFLSSVGYAAFDANRLLVCRFECQKLCKSSKTQLHFLEHHLTHAASSFLVSPFDEAAILNLDMVGERAATFMGLGQGNRIRRIKEINYPHSLGMLYASVTHYLGFRAGNDEFKVMGLASYGEPRYTDVFRQIVRLEDEGGYTLDLSYFNHHLAGPYQGYVTPKFIDTFGPPRPKEDKIEERHKDIAASLQLILEETALHLCRYLYDVTKQKHLCLAGGVALNSVMNGRLAVDSPFEDIYIQPAAGDVGPAVGSAYYIYNTLLDQPRDFVMRHTYYGPEYSNQQIKAELDSCKLDYEYVEDIAPYCAQRLAEGQLVGWYQGRMEWGPRALGNRSILANPTRADMQDIVNRWVKFREDFRPFAPSVLAEKSQEYFDAHYPSPYMLFVCPVKDGKGDVIPAVTHIDGTARFHTVDRDANPLYWDVINEFGKITGVPVVLNTSFNVRGEPIICTPKEAIRCFFSTGLDVLIMGNYVLRKDSRS